MFQRSLITLIADAFSKSPQGKRLGKRSQPSLTRDTLINMGLRIAAVVLASAGISYLHLMSSLETQTQEQLKKYITERGKREEGIFTLAEDNQHLLRQEFLKRLQAMGGIDPQERFNQLFARWSDGTIRNAPADRSPKTFDTQADASVFVGRQGKLSKDLQQRILLSYDMALSYGQAWRNRFLDTYISAPENFTVNYLPGVAWGLEAKPEMNYTQEEWFYITNKQHNPERQTVWTGVYQDSVTKVWMVSAVTPIDRAVDPTANAADNEKQHIATVGNDVLLTNLVNSTVSDHLQGTYNLLFRSDGKLIAHPDLMQAIQSKAGKFNILESDNASLKRIFRLVTYGPRGQVVIDNPADNVYLAIAKLNGPDWYLVTVYPKSLLAGQALENAQFILMLGAIALLVEIVLLLHVLRQKVAVPLKALLGATEHLATGQFDVASLKAQMNRQDELGRLAHSFTSMAKQLQGSFTTLEQRVTQRTAELAQAKAETEQANQELEQRVSARTAELATLLEQLRESQLQMVQNEKMSALGQLVAGVAHEINNPLGFIRGNLAFVTQCIQDLTAHLQLQNDRLSNAQITDDQITAHAEAIDLNYLLADLPNMLRSMKEGTERIQDISASLRIFSRADTVTPVEFDPHAGIDSTLLILKHRLKADEFRPEIQIIREYNALPKLIGFPGQLNQVFMNLLANAIDALEESNQGKSFQDIDPSPNQIRIHTLTQGDRTIIQIQDNGIGMSEQVKQQAFNYLFTTKAVGSGTGLGLAIANQIVTEKHRGTLEVESHLGQGTIFIITLPQNCDSKIADSRAIVG